jgi:hypothetical protein
MVVIVVGGIVGGLVVTTGAMVVGVVARVVTVARVVGVVAAAAWATVVGVVAAVLATVLLLAAVVAVLAVEPVEPVLYLPPEELLPQAASTPTVSTRAPARARERRRRVERRGAVGASVVTAGPLGLAYGRPASAMCPTNGRPDWFSAMWFSPMSRGPRIRRPG